MPTLIIDFFDMGQGDGTLIQFPDGKTTMLVDFGSVRNSLVATPDALTYIQNHTILPSTKLLDYLVLSHGDQDHYNKIPNLFAAISGLKVGEVWIGGVISDYGVNGFNTKYLEPWNKDGIVKIFADGTSFNDFSIGGATVTVVSANYPCKTASDTNAKSIVLQVSYGGNSVMLMADAETPTEGHILFVAGLQKRTASLKSTLLKLGHHGSITSSSPGWIAAVKPAFVYASADPKTNWNHPNCDVYQIVKANTTLATVLKHPYLCTKNVTRGGEYEEHDDTEGIYSSLATVNQGIQVQARLNSNGVLEIRTTNWSSTATAVTGAPERLIFSPVLQP